MRVLCFYPLLLYSHCVEEICSFGRAKGLYRDWDCSSGRAEGLYRDWDCSFGRAEGLYRDWDCSFGRAEGLGLQSPATR